MNEHHKHLSNEPIDLFALEQRARLLRARYIAEGARSLRARIVALFHIGRQRAA